MKISRRNFIASLVVLAACHPLEALADRKGGRRGGEREHDDHDDDHKYADQARRSGDTVPLRDILSTVRETHNGEIVGIEFKNEDNLWVYEIKMIATDGRYIEIYVDAKSNKILKVEGK